MRRFVLAIDQGTTSTRCMIFDQQSQVMGVAQHEHAQIYPQPGWVEHDPDEIWQRTQQVIVGALAAAKRLMRQALAAHLGGRPLISRELFRKP